jgi:hypothetical protein
MFNAITGITCLYSYTFWSIQTRLDEQDQEINHLRKRLRALEHQMQQTESEFEIVE